jgi:small subunit ribosomal protein S4
MLERRLDNVVYRSGFATSRRQARQLVNHGHIFVNERKVNIPSFQVKVGDVVTVKEKSQKTFMSRAHGRPQPDADVRSGSRRRADLSVSIASMPTRQDIDQNINEQLIVELYSK